MAATPTTYDASAVTRAVGPGKHSARAIFSHGLTWGHIIAAMDAGLIRMLPDPVIQHGLPDDGGHIPTFVVFF